MSIAEGTETCRLRSKVNTRAFELKSLAALIFEAMDSEDFTTRNHYTNAMLLLKELLEEQEEDIADFLSGEGEGNGA